ncbi:hypothetical protein [Companilactobacillus kimchii]|uniref:Uncharacterized protein n=2 Tax=Companilactobacillus kimchii TaxID=2801452 RepID=A0ABR5NRI1_9LACO|nr:hypothetical protein [Companilactobacillus kimchii]GEO48532.1 hypothetical protein LKI01_25310 [Companilactobacillus paralimentarius]KAE9559261.1 hypothetical protein ATN91_11470 [Companilactobacillus kimchii]KAE9560784.1 hypothetical protein ATN91_08215 [Companilactobacillus kimchii]KRK50645.1 hypothetical protein FC97_GL001284 [Companilactobacillus kimchii DSM 13961 = JCM 10707]OWF32402.1 hypothetical protein LKACC12383_01919 [Companilactobacillus kimchii]
MIVKIIVILLIVWFTGVFIHWLIFDTKLGKHSYTNKETNDKHISLTILSGYQFGKGNTLFKDKNNNYYFDSNKTRLKLDHIVWDGFNSQIFEVRPETQTIKSKHVLGRSLVGGALAGVPGALIGGTTSKKTVKTNKSLTTTTREPKPVSLLFTEIESDKQVITIISISKFNSNSTSKLDKLESFTGLKHEWSFDISD